MLRSWTPYKVFQRKRLHRDPQMYYNPTCKSIFSFLLWSYCRWVCYQSSERLGVDILSIDGFECGCNGSLFDDRDKNVPFYRRWPSRRRWYRGIVPSGSAHLHDEILMLIWHCSSHEPLKNSKFPKLLQEVLRIRVGSLLLLLWEHR